MDNQNGQRSSEVIAAELQTAKDRGDVVVKLIAQSELETATLKTELREIRGGWRDGGTISRLISELEHAKRFEVDTTALKVVLIDPNNWERKEYVVSRVTPMRIYIRTRGSDRESQYYHDGKPVSYGKDIDMLATFGVQEMSLEIWKSRSKNFTTL